jgi:large repetitive protein
MLRARRRGSLSAPVGYRFEGNEDHMSRLFSALALFSLAMALLVPMNVFAHDGQHEEELLFNIHHVRYDVSGTGLSVVASPSTLGLLQGGGGLNFFVADRPFSLYDNRGEEAPELWSVVIQSMVGLDLHGVIGFGMAELGVHLPIIPVTVWGSDPTDGDFPVPSTDTAGIGDLTLVPKVRILDPAKRPFGLGLQLPVSFPTGAKTPFLSEGGVSFAVDILAELRLKGFRALVNVAPLHLRPKVEYGGFTRQLGMSWKAGVAMTALRRIALQGEIWGTVGYQGEHSNTTAEWSVSVSLRPSDEVSFELGAGSGIAGLGTPALRAFGGVRFTSPDRRDKDGDGLVDSKDQCPEEAEDFDDWDDADGCPDSDNDGDGIPDTSDACPLNAENIGVGDDSDGCPDLDADEPVEEVSEEESSEEESSEEESSEEEVSEEESSEEESSEEEVSEEESSEEESSEEESSEEESSEDPGSDETEHGGE